MFGLFDPLTLRKNLYREEDGGDTSSYSGGGYDSASASAHYSGYGDGTTSISTSDMGSMPSAPSGGTSAGGGLMSSIFGALGGMAGGALGLGPVGGALGSYGGRQLGSYLSGLMSGDGTSQPSALSGYMASLGGGTSTGDGTSGGMMGYDPSGGGGSSGTLSGLGNAVGGLIESGAIGGAQASSLLSSLLGLYGGQRSLREADKYGTLAAQAADPFAPQRAQYQTQLQNLMTNPSSFSLSPAAQAQMNIGTQNLQRSAAAQGYLGSGNILGELQQYGQNIASQDYYKQLAALETLSGATTGSPAAAGASISNIFGNRQQAYSQMGAALGSSGMGPAGVGSTGGLGGLINQGVSGVGNWLSNYFSGSNSGSTLGNYGTDYGLGGNLSYGGGLSGGGFGDVTSGGGLSDMFGGTGAGNLNYTTDYGSVGSSGDSLIDLYFS